MAEAENPAPRAKHWTDATVGFQAVENKSTPTATVDAVKWFKSKGRGHQTRMKAVLRW